MVVGMVSSTFHEKWELVPKQADLCSSSIHCDFAVTKGEMTFQKNFLDEIVREMSVGKNAYFYDISSLWRVCHLFGA